MSLPVWEKTRQRVKGLKSMLLPSFLLFSFASYTIFSQRNLQAIKRSRQRLLGAKPCVQRDPPPQRGCDPPPVLHTQSLSAGQVNTMLTLIQHLGAVKRCDSSPRPALEWGLNAILESKILFVFKAGQPCVLGPRNQPCPGLIPQPGQQGRDWD